MRTFVIFVMVNILGAIGWWLGSGFGMGTSYLLSGVCSLAGVWVGWRLYEAYLA